MIDNKLISSMLNDLYNMLSNQVEDITKGKAAYLETINNIESAIAHYDTYRALQDWFFKKFLI